MGKGRHMIRPISGILHEGETIMSTTYSEDDLHLLAGVPHMIGSAMAMAGKSGFIGTGKEMFASARSVLGRRQGFTRTTR